MPLHLHLSTINIFILLHIYINNKFQNKSNSIFLKKIKINKITTIILNYKNQQK